MIAMGDKLRCRNCQANETRTHNLNPGGKKSGIINAPRETVSQLPTVTAGVEAGARENYAALKH